MVNPRDIEQLGLSEGDAVNIRSEHGVMERVALYAFDLPKGSMMAYYPEANILTAQAVDPRSRTPAFKSTPVWIEPA